MSVNSSDFKLKIPYPASHNLNHALQPIDLRLWLQKIPLADSIEMGKKLVKKLKLINRLKLHPQLRVQFIEMLVTHIDRVIFILENNYIDSDAVFPLSPKNKDFSLICIQLTEEMAYAYKLIIQDITLGKFSYKELKPAERSVLRSALFYAVHWLANLIYATALAYQSIPEAVWLDLHTIFAFARANELAFTTFKVRLGAKAERIEYALQDLYIQALLFAMADPVRMRQQEMRTIYQILPHWSKSVSINTWSASIVPMSTCFIIKLHKDKPPLHSTSTVLSKRPPKRGTLVLNTGTLVQILVQILQEFYGDQNINNEEMSIGSATNHLSKATIQRLIKAWGMIPQRHFVRTQMNIEVPLVFGIVAIHAHLLHQDTLQRESAAYLVSDVPELNNEKSTGPSFDLVAKDTNSTYHKDNTQAPKIWDKKTPIMNSNKPISRQDNITLYTVNESIGGFCVDWSRDGAPKIKIGQLIGIPAPQQQLTCALAVVRWIQDDPVQGARVGMQVLTHKVKPISVTQQLKRNYVPTNCLLIPLEKDTDTSSLPCLVAPPLAFNLEDKIYLYIRDGDTEQQVRLKGLVEVNHAFAMFNFEIIK